MRELCPKEGRAGWREYAALAGILALAVALRVWGLRWGLPNSTHSYSYHPDEFLIFGAAYVWVFLSRSLNPKFFNYPSLFMYLAALAMAVAFGYGAKQNEANIYLIARVMTVLMGTGAVAATYWAGRVLFGSTAGLVAALVLAIAPLHVQHSHFATVDVPSTLPVALCLGYAGLVLKRGSWRDYVLAGAMAGLAAGTKYNAGLVILAPVAASLLRDRRTVLGGKFWASVGCMIGAFLISTPGAILYTADFLHGLTYELRHASQGHGLVFAGTGNGFVYTFSSSLMSGLTPWVAVFLVPAVIWTFWSRNRPAMMVLGFALPYYSLISLSQVRFARYSIPLLPAAALLLAWLIVSWYSNIPDSKGISPRRLWCNLWILLLVIMLGCTFALNMYIDLDPQYDAARWIHQHVGKGDMLGMLDAPWFYSPALSKDIGLGTLDQRREAAAKLPYDVLILSDFDSPSEWCADNPPRWIVLTDFETEDALRLRKNDSLLADQRDQVMHTLANIDAVNQRYVVRARFGQIPGVLGFVHDLPHDMRYPTPVISIYELRK